MSVSPRQKCLKPPPVPAMPTVTRTLPRLLIWNSSATASVIGNTVLEPSILMTACAAAYWGAAATARPPSTAVAANLFHNFIILTSYTVHLGHLARSVTSFDDIRVTRHCRLAWLRRRPTHSAVICA